MRVIIGGQCYTTPDAPSLRITRSMSDPVPTCSVNIIDNNSAYSIVAPQEMIILDDQQIPNPTINLALNPSLNPYTTDWFSTPPPSGITTSQTGGGGVTMTFSNAANAAFEEWYQYPLVGCVVPGQTYTFSYYAQATSPVNLYVSCFIDCLDAAQNILSTALLPHTAPFTSNTRYALTFTAPANTSFALITFQAGTTSATNSGSVSFTQIQFEPNWISTLSYPTPWCGPSQTNCVQLPLGYWIRQYRKFAGFVNHIAPVNYHGDVRTLQISGVGYAWLMGTIIGNDTFSNKTDAQIISTLLSKYLIAPPNAFLSAVNMCTTTNVVTGVTVSNLGLNWDDLRTVFDGLCGLSTFYWTINDYWDFIYAPPGYISATISLICDDSAVPDMLTTFPAYDFGAESDYTQPGSNILVLGNSASAQMIDPAQVAQLGQISGYSLPPLSSWMRKINDSTLGSTTDCARRGIAELIQYDTARGIYHLKTNALVIAGEGIRVTSDTDGLNDATLLIQGVTAQWLGTDETRTDVWEYQVDLGVVNRLATNMISRIFRRTNQNTSAPAISSTAFMLTEAANIEDSVAISTTLSIAYAAAALADSPLVLYPLSERAGTIADDVSGRAQNGTTHASPTLNVTSLLTDASDSSTDKAMTFNGTSQYISLPTTGLPTGAHVWSIEGWASIASFPAHNCTIVAFGTQANQQEAGISIDGSTHKISCFTHLGDIFAPTTASAGVTYYIVGTYDGANTRLYVNAQLVAGPSPFTLNVGSTFAYIGADFTTPANFFPGTLDQCAIYNTQLSAVQIATHYAAGTSTYAYYALLTTPTDYLRLGEASGSTANDTSGNAHNGTVNGTVTLGSTALLFNDANTSMLFDGSTGYVSLPTTGLATGAGAWTMEAWINAARVTGAFQAIMSLGTGSGTNSQGADLGIDDSGSGHLVLTDAGGPIITGPSLSASTTYHVAATYDGATARLYLNGVLVGSTSYAYNLTYGIAYIANDFFGDFYDGHAQEAAIYNTPLSAAQLLTHYNVGTTGHQ